MASPRKFFGGLIPPMFGIGPGTERAKTAPQVKPKPGEATGPQNTFTGLPLLAPGGAGLPGLTSTSSTAFPFGSGIWGPFGSPLFPGISITVAGAFFGYSGGYGLTQPRKGSYWTYRLMDLHPTLRLVRHLINAPIMASQWIVRPAAWASDMLPAKAGADAGKPPEPPAPWRKKLPSDKLEQAVRLIEDQVQPLRRKSLPEMLRFTSFGWRGFEKVWDYRDGYYWLDNLKSLLPDWTSILADGVGNFAGLSQGVQGEGEYKLGPEKSFIVTCDGESGNLYGLSRHESAYDHWTDWQSVRLRRALTEGKAAGRVPKLHYRPGTTPTKDVPTGEDNASIAQKILTTVTEGRGVAIPDLQYEDAELMNNPKLAGISPWVLEFEDAGQVGESLKSFVAIQEYQDKLLVRSWCWPERAVLEAHHGTRADAQQHTDTSSVDRELIDDEIAWQFNRSCTDDILTLNFGEEFRGAVEIQPAPLVDRKVEIYSKILEAMAGNSQIGPELFAAIDKEELLNHLDINLSEGADLNGRLEELVQQARDQRTAALDAAQIPQPAINGKTNGKPRPAAAQVLSRWLDLQD